MCKVVLCLTSVVVFTLGLAGSASAELIAHLPFDEGSGLTTKDATGNGHDGTFTETGVAWGEGKMGGCVVLDGSGYIDIASPETIEIGGQDVSVSMWLNSGAKGVFAMSALSKMNPDRHSQMDRVFGINAAGQWDMYQGWVGALTGPDFIRNGEWHHVVFTQDKDYTNDVDLWSLYVDSDLVARRGDMDAGTDDTGHIIRIGQGVGPVGGSYKGSIDDIRIYNHTLTEDEIMELIPLETFATFPSPVDVAREITATPTLSWRQGKYAVQYDLFVGSDYDKVMAATTADTDMYKGQLDTNSYTFPEALTSGKTYYWRIDCIDDSQANSPFKGMVWRFTVKNFEVIDGFETYNDIPEDQEGSNLVFYTWADGYDNPTMNGAVLGYLEGDSSLEVGIVHTGEKSVPLLYNNTVAPVSEIFRTWEAADAQDWSKGGLQSMSLWFYGNEDNGPDPLYLVVADTADNELVVVHPEPNAVLVESWREWIIPFSDLTAAGVNLVQITKIAIGVGDKANPLASGSEGTVLLDDIRAYRARCRADLGQQKADFNGDCVVDELDRAMLEAELGKKLVKPEEVVEVFREAESADDPLPPLMPFWDDPKASGGKYMMVKPGRGGGPDENNIAWYDLKDLEPGDYQLLARTIAPDGKDDSFWIQIPGAQTNLAAGSGWVRWGVVNSVDWMWTPVRSMDDADKQVVFTLEAGDYSVGITYREDGAKIDAFLLTRDMSFDVSVFDPPKTDINEDGIVDAADLALLMESWMNATLWP